MAGTRETKSVYVGVRLAPCELAVLDAVAGPRGRSETLALLLDTCAVATSEELVDEIPFEERVAVVDRRGIDEQVLVSLRRVGRELNGIAARANALARLYAPGGGRQVPDCSDDALQLANRLALLNGGGSIVAAELHDIAGRLVPPEQVPAATVADPVDGTEVRLPAISPVGEGFARDAANVRVRLAPSQVLRLDEGRSRCGVSRSSYLRMLLSAGFSPGADPSSVARVCCYSRAAVARIEREVDVQLRNAAQIERSARRILAHEMRGEVAGEVAALAEGAREYAGDMDEYTMPAVRRLIAAGEEMIGYAGV